MCAMQMHDWLAICFTMPGLRACEDSAKKAVRLALAMGEVVQRVGTAFFARLRSALRAEQGLWYYMQN